MAAHDRVIVQLYRPGTIDPAFQLVVYGVSYAEAMRDSVTMALLVTQSLAKRGLLGTYDPEEFGMKQPDEMPESHCVRVPGRQTAEYYTI